MIRPFRPLALAVLAALTFGLFPAASRADFAYGVTLLDNQLIAVDTTTGQGTLVGPLGANVSPFGLADVNGQLFTFDSVTDKVRQIDPATGATTMTYNTGIGPVLGQGGLAFQNSTVGFLTSALDPTTLNPMDNLYRFDIKSGTSILVGQTSVGGTPTAIEALAFAPGGGTLYGLGKLDGNLYSIDPTTAVTTLIGNTGVAVGSPTGGLAFGPGGTLYATLDDKLFTLNPSTGTATSVGPAGPALGITDAPLDTGFASISGLAFAPSVVPEPSSLVLTGVGLLGACGVFFRRRPRAV